MPQRAFRLHPKRSPVIHLVKVLALCRQKATRAQQNRPTDPDLRHLIDAWPTLPAAVKAGIVAMVKTATIQGT